MCQNNSGDSVLLYFKASLHLIHCHLGTVVKLSLKLTVVFN